jgi:hypothetical protein
MSALVEKSDSAPAVTKVTETINNLDEMRELFLWRFKDVDRAKVMVMYKVTDYQLMIDQLDEQSLLLLWSYFTYFVAAICQIRP